MAPQGATATRTGQVTRCAAKIAGRVGKELLTAREHVPGFDVLAYAHP